MLRNFIFALIAAALILSAGIAFAAPELGKPAPDFSATDVKGQPFKLSDHKGKIVVLEWTNPGCPFVQKHYETGNMQKTQKAAIEKGAEWIAINSSGMTKEGHQTPEELAKHAAGASDSIIDETGTIGHLYEASTTPHMFVIDATGNIAYMGAIDDNSSPRHETVTGAKNYVLAAIDSLIAGQPVETPVTQSYGCSVKYGQ
jgi:peroxiredoxin